MRIFECFLVCLFLTGCAGATKPEPEKPKKDIHFSIDEVKLFPSCLIGETVESASDLCIKNDFDWFMINKSPVGETSSGRDAWPKKLYRGDIKFRKRGLAIIEVENGIVTHAEARFTAEIK